MDVGSKVTLWQKGDRVVTLMIQGYFYGQYTPAKAETGLGASFDGTLREYAAFNQMGLVRMPRNLNYKEASTLSCAAVTSWNALYGLKPLKTGETVLVLGTGGVSVFALQVWNLSNSLPQSSRVTFNTVRESSRSHGHRDNILGLKSGISQQAGRRSRSEVQRRSKMGRDSEIPYRWWAGCRSYHRGWRRRNSRAEREGSQI